MEDKREFFDQRTLDHLHSKGYVFNRTPGSTIENSGMIFDRAQENLVSDHYKTLIRSAARDLDALKKMRKSDPGITDRFPGHQSIFRKYPDFKDRRGELDSTAARKPMQCPRTKFDAGDSSEEERLTFDDRFWFEEGKPYPTLARREKGGYRYNFIEVLEDWVPEPL